MDILSTKYGQCYILGISAFYHDSAAALLRDGEIMAAAQEERFTRKKHDFCFPKNAIRWCLNYAGIGLSDLALIVFYEKPLIKFERLLETYYTFAPKGLKSFLTSIPLWIKEKAFIKKIIKEELENLFNEKFPKGLEIIFPEHHLSHAASAYYPSPFSEAAILTIDGVGEWATASIGYGKGKDITILKELDFPNSLGLLYSAFTYYTGFKVNSGEYKLMGLAPYGNPHSDRTKKYIDLIYSELVEVKNDGSLWLNMDYFDFATGLKMTKDEKWENLFGIPSRTSGAEITQEYMDMAYAIQKVTEDTIFKMAKHVKEITGAKYLTMAGGVALNCVANGKLLKSVIFDDIWIQPAASDAGGALGAAYVGWYIYFDKERINWNRDQMKGSFLGPEFSDLDVEQMARKYNAPFFKFDEDNKLIYQVTKLLSEGRVVGWFQGKTEWGPRALGNRSILADARDPDTQKKLNLKIKFRESFRPFAPSVLVEDLKEYFDFDRPSPYMLLIAEVSEMRRRPLPENYYTLALKDKLYYLRSDIPAITHLDYSARLQTVDKETNLKYWKLIKAFKDLTGYGIIVNTSFNVRGEPIVCTPEEAYQCFMRTEMDFLVIENYLFDKREQPQWSEEKNWRDQYALD